jgi:hypothetical protein
VCVLALSAEAVETPWSEPVSWSEPGVSVYPDPVVLAGLGPGSGFRSGCVPSGSHPCAQADAGSQPATSKGSRCPPA